MAPGFFHFEHPARAETCASRYGGACPGDGAIR